MAGCNCLTAQGPISCAGEAESLMCCDAVTQACTPGRGPQTMLPVPSPLSDPGESAQQVRIPLTDAAVSACTLPCMSTLLLGSACGLGQSGAGLCVNGPYDWKTAGKLVRHQQDRPLLVFAVVLPMALGNPQAGLGHGIGQHLPSGSHLAGRVMAHTPRHCPRGAAAALQGSLGACSHAHCTWGACTKGLCF